MLWLDLRAARYTWTVALILLLLGALYLIRETLFIFAVSVLFAYLLWPLVNLFDRRLPGRSRVAALTIVYLLLVVLLVVIGINIGSRLMGEADALTTRIPALISQLQQPAAPIYPAPVSTAKSRVVAILRKQLGDHAQDLLPLLPNAALTALSHAGNLVVIVLVPILSFFFIKDGRQIISDLLGAVAKASRRDVAEIAADLDLLLAQYVRALVFLALAAFAAYALFFSLIGVPYAMLLAAVAFPLEFIPMLGPLVAAGIILIVAGLSGFSHLMWIAVFIILFRIFQDYVLSPHLLSAGVELHPLVIIFGVLAGASIAGIPGVFLSVPVLATLRVVYRQLQNRAHASDSAAPGPNSMVNNYDAGR